jgi:RimJ/RimL family protein N-acetyltransferase
MKFDPSQEYILENDKVLLRPLTLKDKEHFLPYSLNEPDLWTYSLTPASGEANLDEYLTTAIAKRQQGDSYPFITLEKQTGRYMGSTRFYDIQPQHNTMQMGYTWFANEFQGTGLNKNCKYLLLEFAFEQVGVERVEFRADAKNTRSIAAMKSLGCTVEGILRSNCASPTGRRDSIVLSILRDEWLGGIKRRLKERL